ncbi:MAG: hypothetical protein KBT31_05530, partial [Firmicutes bacterium]|nr:hypothetical protein [Candidatus Colimorpha enterica]
MKKYITCYHFNPAWTVNYGTDFDARMKEFDDVLSENYFNCIIVDKNSALEDRFWEIAYKHKCDVWLNVYDFYRSGVMDFEEWLKPFDAVMKKIVGNKEREEIFLGFHMDEPIWRGQSNADFLKETEELTKRYGKRIFPVFSTGEFTSFEGNEMQLNLSAEKMKKVMPEALKYVTDAAFDSYSYDFREPEQNGNKLDEIRAKYPSVTDAKSYFRLLTDIMLKMIGHKVTLWFFPTVYTTNTWGGYRVDESFCLGHLDFFSKLLEEAENPGGLVLYTYMTSKRNPVEKGLENHLIVKPDGEQTLLPDVEKWETYSAKLKDLLKE